MCMFAISCHRLLNGFIIWVRQSGSGWGVEAGWRECGVEAGRASGGAGVTFTEQQIVMIGSRESVARVCCQMGIGEQ